MSDTSSDPPGGRDADDWARAGLNDGEAFARIFDGHRARVLRHCIRLVPSPSDAEDAVAITFFEAWRHRERARLVDGSLLPWLLVICTNVTRNLDRSSRRYRALLARLPAAEPVADHAARFDDGPASAALRTLSLDDRRIIALCVLEGLTDAEAAAVLRIPHGTAKSRLSRAKRRLAAALDRDARPLLRPSRLMEAPHEA